MAIKDNLGGGLKVNGNDISIPLKSGQTVNKGDPVYMAITTPSINTTYTQGPSGQTYSSTNIKCFPALYKSRFFTIYTEIIDEYMYVNINLYAINSTGDYKLLTKKSVKTYSATNSLNVKNINYIYNNYTLNVWFLVSNVLYIVSIQTHADSIDTPSLYAINLISSNVTSTISGASITSFTPTSTSIKGCVISHGLLCFHLIRANSSYRAFEMLAIDATKYTISSITAYRTGSYGESNLYYADIKSSGDNVMCYHRQGYYYQSSTKDYTGWYYSTPPTIYMYMGDPQSPTTSYSRQNAIGSSEYSSISSWGTINLNSTFGKTSATHINRIVDFRGSYFTIYLPQAYNPYDREQSDATKLVLFKYIIGYGTHTNAYSSSTDSDVTTMNAKWDDLATTSGNQLIPAKFSLSDTSTIQFNYLQETLHSTSITVSCPSLSSLITPTKVTLSTANAFYTAKQGLTYIASNTEWCVFLDTIEGHFIKIKNPMTVSKYNISGHSSNLPIGIAKHSNNSGNIKIRNYVL